MLIKVFNISLFRRLAGIPDFLTADDMMGEIRFLNGLTSFNSPSLLKIKINIDIF